MMSRKALKGLPIALVVAALLCCSEGTITSNSTESVKLLLLVDHRACEPTTSANMCRKDFFDDMLLRLNSGSRPLDLQLLIVYVAILNNATIEKLHGKTGEQTKENLRQYVLRENLREKHDFDVPILIVNEESLKVCPNGTEKQAAGLTNQNSMCNPEYAVVVVAFHKEFRYHYEIADLILHEIGHLLGMHDEKSGEFIMSLEDPPKNQTGYSPESIKEYEQAREIGLLKCLSNITTAKSFEGICSTAQLEAGDYCDCERFENCDLGKCDRFICKPRGSTGIMVWIVIGGICVASFVILIIAFAAYVVCCRKKKDEFHGEGQLMLCIKNTVQQQPPSLVLNKLIRQQSINGRSDLEARIDITQSENQAVEVITNDRSSSVVSIDDQTSSIDQPG